MTTTSTDKTAPQSPVASGRALLPLVLFLLVFLGTGSYLTWLGMEFAFYQLPAPIAVLPAMVLALMLSKDSINHTIEQFIRGCGDSNVMAMCMIYLLAGGFAAVAKATGGVDATVNLGLSVLPSWFLLPGFFLISAFIATAMGTSMGTLGAVAPIALGVAESADLDLAVMAGAVLSGAMFGDNLSIISDTTIAATRTQGCEMKDKFKENLKIALPAAAVVILLLLWLGEGATVPEAKEIQWLQVMPYIVILVLAVSGLNVFVVLGTGILLAGAVGLLTQADYGLMTFSKDIYQGFKNMQEIFLLSLLIGGLGALMAQQGGLAYITSQVNRLMHKLTGLFGQAKNAAESERKAAELAIGGIVGLTTLGTANNTVGIIVAGSVAKELSHQHQLTAKRSASLLDIFACSIQGLLPYGAQTLLLGSLFALSPLDIASHGFYPLILMISAVGSVLWFTRPVNQPQGESA